MSSPTVSDEAGPARADSLQSLTRGLAVIRSFDEGHAELTLSEVARRAGISRAAARRILHTLEDLGYVRSREGRFALTPRVLELGGAYLASSTLAQVAAPHLEKLTARVDESSSVSELDGDDIVYVARVARSRIMSVSIGIGTRFPAYATSMGQVLLAGRNDRWLDGYLARAELAPLAPNTITDPARLRERIELVRDRGWALADEELEVGLRSVAVPVHGDGGAVVAAANVSSTTRCAPAGIEAQMLPELLRCADAVSADLAVIGERRR